jgi:hypothetical protein
MLAAGMIVVSWGRQRWLIVLLRARSALATTICGQGDGRKEGLFTSIGTKATRHRHPGDQRNNRREPDCPSKSCLVEVHIFSTTIILTRALPGSLLLEDSTQSPAPSISLSRGGDVEPDGVRFLASPGSPQAVPQVTACHRSGRASSPAASGPTTPVLMLTATPSRIASSNSTVFVRPCRQGLVA